MAFSFTQLCRQCKEDFKTFKIELSCYEEESGKCCLSNNEIFENFSFFLSQLWFDEHSRL